MAESWTVDGGDRVASGQDAATVLAARIDEGELTTYLTSDAGRVLAVVSDRVRAMVVLMTGAGDPGEHAISPNADGSSDGFLLENGQEDTYDDRDTVRVADALDIVRGIVYSGAPPTAIRWSVDR